MKNKIKYIILFFIMSFSIMAADSPVGELFIKVDLNPVGKVKSYSVDGKRVLDTGIYNSQDAVDVYNQIIAKVSVVMEAKKRINESGKNPCAIDGEFMGDLKIKDLETAVNGTSIELKIKNYNDKSNNIKMTLKSINYKEGNTIKDEIDTSDENFVFSPYPNGNGDTLECPFNTIQRLEYTFDLALDVTGVQNGAISGGTVEITGDTGKGAIKDLVTEQIFKIMTRN